MILYLVFILIVKSGRQPNGQIITSYFGRLFATNLVVQLLAFSTSVKWKGPRSIAQRQTEVGRHHVLIRTHCDNSKLNGFMPRS
jgi:hypothetical protein